MWKEPHWVQPHFHRFRTEGRQHNRACCHPQWWCPMPYPHYWPVQHRAPHNIPERTLWEADPTWGETAVEAGHANLVIILENVVLHHSHLVNKRFAVHPRMMMQFLQAYFPFLNPMEGSPSLWCLCCPLWLLLPKRKVQRNVKVGYGMQEDFPLSAFQDTVLNVMWMKPRGPIDKTVDTEDQ